MKDIENSFKTIPIEKKKELRRVVNTIHQRVKHLSYSIEMIILFGSYARGEGLEDVYQSEHITYEYQSDFDLLIIVPFKNINKQNSLEKKLCQAIEENNIKTPVSLIIHDIEFVNQALADFQYFFIDIEREGIVLYDSKKYELRKPIPLSPIKRLKFAREDFTFWFEKACDFYQSSTTNYKKAKYNLAIFELHQCTEALHYTVLLVYTRYKPKRHNLVKLRRLICDLDHHFITSFPSTTTEDQKYFEKLCKAYIEARYKRDYSVTQNEIKTILSLVKSFSDLVEKLCQKKINEFHTLANKSSSENEVESS